MIPEIDATRLDAPATRAALARAATQTGFLTLSHTPIPPAEVAALIAEARAFFHLPETRKAEIDMARTGSNRGWGRPGAERVDPASNPDYKQVFDMGFELPPSDPLARHGLRYYAPNRWPEGLPGFRAAMEGYYARALGVAGALLAALAAAIGRPPDHFAAAFDRPMALLRANYYPPRPAWAGPRDHGIAPHTDYGCLTLLASDGRPGLEVRLRSGAWVPVSAPPGTFIVNFGEMLETWTGGQVRATLHRVRGTAAERLSLPLFVNPRYDIDVAPPGAARPVLAGDHLSRRFEETYLHLGQRA